MSYPVTAMSMPAGITNGPDGNLWFVELNAHQFGKITPAGAVTEYPLTSPPMWPSAIVSGVAGTPTAGNLWLTDFNSDLGVLDEVTTSGTVTLRARGLPRSLGGIAPDSLGNLWIAFPLSNEIGEVKPPSYSSVIPYPTGGLLTGADPHWITAGPDGQTMWFTEPGVDSIASITQGGVVTQYAVSPHGNPRPDRSRPRREPMDGQRRNGRHAVGRAPDHAGGRHHRVRSARRIHGERGCDRARTRRGRSGWPAAAG